MVERFELLDELKKEFESVSGPLSKIDELPDFVENRIWVEIQRLLEENAYLKKRLVLWQHKEDLKETDITSIDNERRRGGLSRKYNKKK